MAKPKKNQAKKSKGEKYILLWVCVIIIISIGTVTAVLIDCKNQKSEEQARALDMADRQKFEDVKLNVKTLSNQLESSDAINAKWDFEASCARASVKFEVGEAHCALSTGAEFKINKAIQAKPIIDTIDQIIEKSGLFPEDPSDQKEYPNFATALQTEENGPSASDRYAHRVYNDAETGMDCSLNFQLRRSGKDNRLGHPLLIASFACGEKARNTWFPRNDI